MNFLSEHALELGIVDAVVKSKFRLAASVADGPTRERASHLDHVLLRIAGVDSQRVQLHQFAPIILVETTLAYRRQFGILPAAKLLGMRLEPLGGLRIGA